MAASESNLATAKTILTTIGTVAATTILIRGVVQELLPPDLQDYLYSGIRSFFASFSTQLTMVVEEFDGLAGNELYEAAESYLGPKASPSTRRLKISRPEKEKHYSITLERGQEITDTYKGAKFRWVRICRATDKTNFHHPRDMNSTLRSEVRSFEVTFHYKNFDMAINSYLPYITEESKKRKQEKKTIKIFTVDYDVWRPVTLDHPATFETLAMDSGEKRMILEDLERFLRRREYYRRVGKAWKRGYLLYGPPGTGKSSLIAAMANYLKFDVYDLELTELGKNSDLRRLLVATANKSILVVEDIDCTIDLGDRAASSPAEVGGEESQVTLSGLLNFVDGLWSCIGDERIIIFTTNHIEKLDPALLRPGRMDVHVHMSYCTPCGFRLFSSNYLGIKDHAMFGEVEDLIRSAKVTPAEVAEQLLKDDDPDVSLRGLANFIRKKMEQDEAAGEKVQAANAEAGDHKHTKKEESKEINVEGEL